MTKKTLFIGNWQKNTDKMKAEGNTPVLLSLSANEIRINKKI